MNVSLKIYYFRQLVKIGMILLFAIIPTYFIYNSFKDKRDQIRSSESLSITFHESEGDKVTLKEVAPVTDSVGLSSRAYTFTIKNNLEVPVKYSVKLIEDTQAINDDKCATNRIPMQVLKVGIHKGREENKVLSLNSITDNIIAFGTVAGYSSEEYTVRIWAQKGSLATDNDLHFHGILQVIENGTDIASATVVK